MAIRPILVAPNPILRIVSQPVTNITEPVLKLIEDMVETLDHSGGVGLAAPQVGISQRIIVVWVDDNAPYVVINPNITYKSGEVLCDEGCLSVPGMQGKVKRAAKVTVKGISPDGAPLKIEATGLMAQAFQHEIDHLDGIIYTDIMEPNSLIKVKPKKPVNNILDDVWKEKHAK